MKKLFVIMLALMLAVFCGCSRNDRSGEGWRDVLDLGIKFPSEFNEEQVSKCLPPEEIEFNKANASGRSETEYFEGLRLKYASIRDKYNEKYGDDWKLSWELREAVVKDDEGIKKYLSYDSYYFETYGIDTSKISAVTFAKITVKIEGSKGSNQKDKTVQCFCLDGEWYSFYALAVGAGL